MPRTKVIKDFLDKLDFLPEEKALLDKVREPLATLAGFYGFERVQTPLIEEAWPFQPLFKAGMFLDREPVVSKTKAGQEILLRPSGTLSLLRMHEAYKLGERPQPLKFAFEGDGFFVSRESGGESPLENLLKKPSAPGIRRNHEFGFAIFGEEGPVGEAQILQAIWRALEKTGIAENFELKLNAAGCGDCRPLFRTQLNIFLRNRAKKFCRECRRGLKKTPTAVFQCEDEKCQTMLQNAPEMLDFLCDSCKRHLKGLLEFTEEMKIPYFLDPRFFRDGSWYSRFIFEIAYAAMEEEIGSGLVVAEGGRLERASEMLWGKIVSSVGGVLFLDRLLGLAVPVSPGVPQKPKVFLAQLGELAKKRSFGILENLRAAGLEVAESLGKDSIKSQLKLAERGGAELTLILGHKEALDGNIIVREVKSGAQETIAQEALVEFLKQKLKI